MKTKGKISYGKKALVGGPVQPHEELIRISMLIEGDLLDALKAAAHRTNVGYTTLMKEMARAALGLEAKLNIPGRQLTSSPSQGEELKAAIEELRGRITSLERKRA